MEVEMVVLEVHSPSSIRMLKIHILFGFISCVCKLAPIVLHRNSSTGCSSLRCRGGTESGLGKRVTVAPDGHASSIDAFRVNWRKVDNVGGPKITLVL